MFVNLPVLLVLAATVIAGGSAMVVTLVQVNRAKVLHNAKVAEANLRKHVKYYKNNPANLKKHIKNFYKAKLKCANKRLLLGVERGLTQNNYKEKRMNKGFFGPEIRVAEHGLAVLENKKAKTIQDLERAIEVDKRYQEVPYYAEKIMFDNKLVVELSTNSIISDSSFIINDYRLALEPTSQKKYYDRTDGSGIYPMVTEIQDQSGKTIMKISDVTPQRYVEFTEKILAKLYEKMEREEQIGQSNHYKIYAYDSLGKGRRSTSNYRMDLTVSSKESVKDEYEGAIKAFIYSFKGMQKHLVDRPFDELVEFYRYETKMREMKQNSIHFNTDSALMKSNILINKYNVLADRVKLQAKEQNPILMSVSLNNGEIVRASADNNELRHLSLPLMLAYAFVIAFDREREGLVSSITIKTARLDAKNQQVLYAPNETMQFSDTESLLSLGETYPSFWTTAQEIAREKGISLETVQQPVQEVQRPFTRTPKIAPQPTAEPKVISTKRDDFINCRVQSTEQAFYNKMPKSNMDQSYPFVTKIESKTTSSNPDYKCNISMATYSRALQAETFLDLLLEAYVIQNKEFVETNKNSPMAVSVYWQKVLDENTNQRNIESTQRVYASAEDLKKEIFLFTKNNFKTSFVEKDFDAKVKAMGDELYPTQIATETSIFQF